MTKNKKLLIKEAEVNNLTAKEILAKVRAVVKTMDKPVYNNKLANGKRGLKVQLFSYYSDTAAQQKIVSNIKAALSNTNVFNIKYGVKEEDIYDKGNHFVVVYFTDASAVPVVESVTKKDIVKKVLAELKAKGLLNEKAIKKHIFKKPIKESKEIYKSNLQDVTATIGSSLEHYENYLKENSIETITTLTSTVTFKPDMDKFSYTITIK